jgi:hypothetical protein
MGNSRFGWHSGSLKAKSIELTEGVTVKGAPVDYLHSAMGVGVYGTPVIDTALVDNIAFTVNMSTGTNKTVADTSSMAVFIGNKNTADVIHAKMQGILSSMTIAYDCFDAYAGQFNFAITDTMATHDGNANLVALAAKASITDSKTATGNVSALYLVTGATGATTGDTATGTFDALRFENNATTLDSFINFGGCTGATYAMTFDASAGCVADATSTTISGDGVKIKVKVGSTALYLRAYVTA